MGLVLQCLGVFAGPFIRCLSELHHTSVYIGKYIVSCIRFKKWWWSHSTAVLWTPFDSRATLMWFRCLCWKLQQLSTKTYNSQREAPSFTLIVSHASLNADRKPRIEVRSCELSISDLICKRRCLLHLAMLRATSSSQRDELSARLYVLHFSASQKRPLKWQVTGRFLLWWHCLPFVLGNRRITISHSVSCSV